jgi:ABC-2 type transport system permease protein
MLAGIWKVARFEYRRVVFRKRFLLVLLTPLLILLFSALAGFASVAFLVNTTPIGYVDLTGKLILPVVQTEDTGRFSQSVAVLPFADEASGRAAVEDEHIQALYVVAPDYFQTGQVRMVAKRVPSENAGNAMERFLRRNLVADQPPDTAERLLAGPIIRFIRQDQLTGRPNEQGFLKIILAAVFSFLFLIILSITSGYMLTAVIDEKTNRTVEILITSVSSMQLMTGKILGNLAVGVTQLLVWGSVPILGVSLAAVLSPALVNAIWDGSLIFVSLGLSALAVLLFAALLTALGASVTESREAQQVSAIMTLLFILPVFFMQQIMLQPHSALVMILSILPPTAPMTMPVLMAVTQVPVWQIGLSFGLLTLSAAGALWLASYAFRRGMLQYDKRLHLRDLFQRKGRGQ